jgi:hypothetical protein
VSPPESTAAAPTVFVSDEQPAMENERRAEQMKMMNTVFCLLPDISAAGGLTRITSFPFPERQLGLRCMILTMDKSRNIVNFSKKRATILVCCREQE